MTFSQFTKKAFVLLTISVLIFLSLKFNAPTWEKGLIFIIYWLIAASFWRRVLIVRFDFSPTALRVRLLAALGVLAVVGWSLGAGLYFYRFTPMVAALALFLAALIPLCFWAEESTENEMATWFSANLKIFTAVPTNKAGVFLYIFLWLACLHQLFNVTGGGSAPNTPWQILPATYIYWFLAATVVLGFLCFAKLPAKVTLLLLIAHAFLLASYLPATHSFFYNGDQWRHLGQELNLAAGNTFATVRPPEPLTIWQRIDIGHLAYSQFWSLAVIAKSFFNFDLMNFNRWFEPILWALFFPILVFEWARSLRFSKSFALLAVWLGFLPFALQVGGAITLPVSTGFLFWLFLLLLAVKRVPGWPGAVFLLILGGLSIFGYTLYFVLFWAGFAIYNFQFTIFNKFSIYNFSKKILFILPFFIVAFSLPAIELVTNYSHFDPNINWLAQAQQAVGNFSAYYLASGPRPHDIASGNILFNQVPSYAFVVNVFTYWRYWLVGLAVLFWFSAVAGGFVLVYSGGFGQATDDEADAPNRKKLLAILFFGLMSGYIISRYFLTSDNLLTRRLDLVLAWLAIMAVAAIFSFIFEDAFSKQIKHRVWLFFVVFALALTTVVSYTLGPDAITVNSDEYAAMNYVWSQYALSPSLQEGGRGEYCVLADTYPLLALEVISAKKIIGGGFAIDGDFAQPERVRLYDELSALAPGGPASSGKFINVQKILTDAKNLTGSSICYGVVKNKKGEYNESNIVQRFGDVVVLKQ